MSTPIDEILKALEAPNYEAIEVWRVPGASSARSDVAYRSLLDDAEHPGYGARFEGKEKLITSHDFERLAQAGAHEIKLGKAQDYELRKDVEATIRDLAVSVSCPTHGTQGVRNLQFLWKGESMSSSYDRTCCGAHDRALQAAFEHGRATSSN